METRYSSQYVSHFVFKTGTAQCLHTVSIRRFIQDYMLQAIFYMLYVHHNIYLIFSVLTLLEILIG